MALPLKPPIAPMLAKLERTLPEGDDWLYEPKWDGFRALVFKDGDDVYLQSRDLKPLARYFPELVDAMKRALPERCVLDGEIVIARATGTLDFETLLLRIHPAKSRIDLLAHEAPTSFVAWDLLAIGDDDLRARPLQERRALLEKHVGTSVGGVPAPSTSGALVRPTQVLVAPATRDRAVAAVWFSHFEGAGLDGVVSKKLDSAYTPGKRTMVKTKHARTADCVVAGFRWFKGGKNELVGSLLLGLYDDDDKLHHTGICSSFTRDKRKELVTTLEPYRANATSDHPWGEWADWQAKQEDAAPDRRVPGGQSRWSRGKDLSWVPLRVELVVEVAYDHMQGDRFRHATHFVRWRPDKQPAQCRYDQLEVTPAAEIAEIFR